MNRIPSHIISYPYNNYLILLEPVSHRLFILNASGRFIWENLDSAASHQKLAQKMAEVYSIGKDRALQDIKQCLNTWYKQGLFTPKEECRDLLPQENPYSTRALQRDELETKRSFPLKNSFVLANIILETRCTTQELQQLVLTLFPHLHITATTERPPPDLIAHLWSDQGQIRIALNGKVLAQPASRDAQIDWLIAEFIDATYRHKQYLSVLHAGALGGEKKAILFAGSSGSGKSTLIASLQQQGYTFLADDICPVTMAGMLFPVPMSQNIKKGSWNVLARIRPELWSSRTIERKNLTTRYLPPLHADASAWNHPWPVSTLIFPLFAPQSPPALTAISPLTALTHLINSGSLCGNSIPEFISWISSVSTYSLLYPSLQDAATLLYPIIRPDP